MVQGQLSLLLLPDLATRVQIAVSVALSSLSLTSAWQAVGCDHNLDSAKQEDKCLQCGGDGTTCYPVTGTFDASDLSRGGGLLPVPSWPVSCSGCHLMGLRGLIWRSGHTQKA